jgi:molecular chaperone DnaK (HSP70)
MRLGIDFGTTRSVVAFCDRGNYPVISFLTETGDAIEWYPSVVAERDGELRYGFDALQAAAADPSWHLLRSFKRLLSEGDASPQMRATVGSSRIPIVELLAGFLTALRKDLLTRSNLPKSLRKKAEVMQAVIATPAHSHSTQRFLTLDAFRRAGFEVLSLVNEPSAAGFEYTHRYRNTITSKREHVVVYDLGGGTFDVSLLRMSGSHHDVLTTAGVAKLGGDDFDAVLVQLVAKAANFETSALDERELDQLTDQCRSAKESLNPNSKRIVVDLESCLTQAPVSQITITAADFYEACQPLIERSIDAMVPVMARIELEEPAADALGEIAGIYVVGGASSLPAVARELKKRFGRRVHKSPYPSAATAIGLAIASDDASGFALEDRFSRIFGVFREEQTGSRVSFDPIFTSDTRMPGPTDQPTSSQRKYRAAHNIGHFRFVECRMTDSDGAPVGDITPYGEIFFPFDPSLHSAASDLRDADVTRSDGEGPWIEEDYTIDQHGIVHVKIRNLDAQYEQVHRLGS